MTLQDDRLSGGGSANSKTQKEPANGAVLSADIGTESLSTASETAVSKPVVLNADAAKRTRFLIGAGYALCCLVWGTTWFAIRIAMEPGDGFPPMFAASLRFIMSVGIFAPLWLLRSKHIPKPSKAEIVWLIISGFFNGLYQCFIYASEQTISGGLASVIMATSPIMLAVIVIFTGFEKVRKQTLIGFLVCLCGVALVCHDRLHTASDQLIGIGLALCAALFTGLSNLTLKGRGTGVHPLASASIFLTATAVPVCLATFIMGEKPVLEPFPVLPSIAVLYMTLTSSVIAFTVFLYIIRHMSLMAITTMQFILPIVALIVDLFLEKRVSLSVQSWAGILIVLCGVVYSLRRR